MSLRSCLCLALAIPVVCTERECSSCSSGTMGPSLIQRRVHRNTWHEPIVSIPTRTLEGFPEDLGQCALVGSSSILTGKGHGPDIDRYETVIRVNRVPTPEYFADFGNKTTIFFGNTYVWASGMVQLFGGAKVRVVRNNHGLFSNLVMNSWIPAPNWEHITDVWHEAPYRVGHAADSVMRNAFSLAAAHPLPTAGLFAMLTFAPICDHMDIYGFGGGEETADEHVMNVFHKHAINAEHALIDRIANGTLTESDIKHRDAAAAGEVREHLAELRGRIVRVGR